MSKTASRREKARRLRMLAAALRTKVPYPSLVEICMAEREADNLDRDVKEFIVKNWKRDREVN